MPVCIIFPVSVFIICSIPSCCGERGDLPRSIRSFSKIDACPCLSCEYFIAVSPPSCSGRSSDLPPVAHLVAGWVVVPTVHLASSRPVEMDRNRRAVARVSYPVDPIIARQDRGGAIFRAPPQLPDPLQAGVI